MTHGRRGDVWEADLGPIGGGEQAGARPVVVAQTDDLQTLATTVVIPLTSSLRQAGFPTTVKLEPGEGGLGKTSVALCHQLRVLDRRKLIRQLGTLPPAKLSEIEAAVAFVLGLPS
ncbi:MAG: type II toxin-antitoxin system PemK/MazF family toxin [Candidatus Rokubacteria bacterium]|nr:type II toxin-antitoxin system PemK/MazF family toxin [Candidatus Rokubacteria bacterium]